MLGLRWTLQSRPHPQNRNAKAKSKSHMQRVSRSCFCPGERSDQSQIHRECCKPAAPMSRYHRKWPNAGSGHGGRATSNAEARHDSPIGAAAASRRHDRHSGETRGPRFRTTHPNQGGRRVPRIAGPAALVRSRWRVGSRGHGVMRRRQERPSMQSQVCAVRSWPCAAMTAVGSGGTAPSDREREMKRGRADIAPAAGRRSASRRSRPRRIELIIGQPNPRTEGDERRIGGAELDLPLRHLLIAAVFNLF